MNLQLQNKIAFIAGSSDGLGFATAMELAREGAKVVLTGRNAERLKEAESKLRNEIPNAQVLSCTVDVVDANQIQQAIDEAVKKFGGLDIMITNAAGPPVNEFEALTEENWLTAYNLTLMSAVRLIKCALPHLRKSKSASILTITSTSAKQPLPGLLLSNTFRPAVLGLTKTLSQELAKDNIRVNSILPGWTATERSKKLLATFATKNNTSDAEEIARIAADVPLGRMATPEEFAQVAAFLVSPAASYITGVMMPVDGGRTKGLI